MILEYEIYVFKFYLEILNFVKATMTRNKSTLEEDLDLLEEGPDRPVMGFTLRMAIMYRSEKKKIIYSQIHLIQKVLSILRATLEL